MRCFPVNPLPQPRCVLGLLSLLGLLCCGCSTSSFVARQFLRPPRSFPQAVAPQPRVYFSFPQKVTDAIPEQRATVGHPAITLNYRCIPSGDYGARMILTNHAAYGRLWPLYAFPAHTATPLLPSRGTVVLLHGYALDHETLVPWALSLAGHGWTCVLVDLRGHGKSEGDRITFGIEEAQDLSALMEELQSRGQAHWPVQVLGVSYGSAVALRWATQEPRVQGVVAVTPYTELTTAVEGLRQEYASWLPARTLQRATAQVPRLVGVGPRGLDPDQWLREHPVPALFIAAESDPIAPPSGSRLLASYDSRSHVLELPKTSHEIAPFRIDLLLNPVAQWLDGKR